MTHHRAYRRISVSRTHREIPYRDPAPLFWAGVAVAFFVLAGILWLS